MIPFTPIHILFKLGPLTIYSWGLMFVIAFIVCSLLFLRDARKKGIKQETLLNILLLVLLGAIIGGRFFFILEHLSFFISNPLEIISFGKGGETSYGGILLALFFVWVYTKKNKEIKFLEILDIAAPYLALGLVIGRIGCFLNWDDFGIISSLPWSVLVPGDVARHPTQLYESVYCLFIFFILISFKKIIVSEKNTRFKQFVSRKGSLFFSFLFFYSIFRFFNDFLRIYENYFLGLAFSQWLLIIVFLISIISIRKNVVMTK